MRPVCDLHPEFGYIGPNHRRLRTLRNVLAFTVFGLLAGASGVAVFMAAPDPDPMRAMALAPGEDLAPAAESLPTVAADAAAAAARMTFSGARRPRPVRALNERPAIAAVAIGHPDGPAFLRSEPEILAAEAPGPAKPRDAAPAMPVEAQPEAQSQTASVEQPTAAPAVSASSARVRSKIVRHRERDDGRHARVRDRKEYSRDRNQYSAWRSYSYANQSGYARLW